MMKKEIVQAIKKLLETQNYSVVTAYNGIEAIEVLKKEDVHIIIMDIMMPRQDGLTTVLQIREEKNKNNSYMIDKILDAYEHVIFFQEIARKEGVLALEEACEELDITDRTQAYMHKLIMLIVDGTEPQMVKEIGMNIIIANAMLSNQEIQRILRETDNMDIVLAMKGLIGKARARIFDNLSTRMGNMIAEDIMYSGPVRLCDVEESCVKIMKTVILLEDRGEIASHDLTTLKVVLDMYEASQKVNQELKEKYKGVKDLVDEIYRV